MKPFIVIQGPVATRSGYGNHTRDLAISLLKSDKYDIQIVSLPWGSCPMNALKANNQDHQSAAAETFASAYVSAGSKLMKLI